MTAFFELMFSHLLKPLLGMSITAAFVAVIVLLLRLILKRKAPKQVVCLLWLVVFARLLIPSAIEAPFSLVPAGVTDAMSGVGQLQEEPSGPADSTPSQNFAGDDAPVYTVPGQPPVAAPPVTDPVPTVTAPVAPGPQPPVQQGQTSAAPVEPEIPAEEPKPFPWPAVISLLWAVGFLVMLASGVGSYVHLRRRVYNAIRGADGVWEHPAITAPFILGLFRPKIYLPMGIEGRPRQFILQHEQAHLRRLDYIVKPICWLALAIHWFNPLAWAAFLLLSRDIETACDERVLRELGPEIKADYSATLLALATDRKFPAPTPLSFGEGDAKVRIKNVVSFKKPALWVTVVAAVVVVVTALCLLTNQTVADDPGPEVSLPPVVESEPPVESVEPTPTPTPVTMPDPDPLFPGLLSVTPVEDSAEGGYFTRFRLTCDGRELIFSGKATDNEMRAVDGVYTADLNGDEVQEIIVALTVGYGTGYLQQELYVFDSITLEEYPADGLVDDLKARFAFSADEDNFYVAAEYFSAVIPKEEIGYDDLMDNIYIGDVVRFVAEEGRLYCTFGCCVGNIAVYYGELWVELELEGGELIPVGYELRGVNGTMEQEVLEQFSAVLMGDRPIVNTESGEEYFLSQVARQVAPYESFDIIPTVYALVDLDRDGVQEMILDLPINEYSFYGYLILRYQEGAVYGFIFSQRQFGDLRADGTFWVSGGASDNGICRIGFDKVAYAMDQFIYSETLASGEVIYVVDHRRCAQAEFDAAVEAWQKVEPVEWLPLTEGSAQSEDAPAFLTEEQQILYLRARELYGMLFGANVAEGLTDGYKNCSWVTIDGTGYVIGGRYQNWSDLEATVHALFTDEFWQTRNDRGVFVEYEGKTAILDGGMGAGYYYNPNFADTFTLISATEDEIVFTVTGHYTQVWPIEGMTGEERDEYRRTTCEYTYDFTIRMVRTEAGWRFDEFRSPQTDEKSPEDEGIVIVNERPAVWEPTPDPAADAFLAALRDEVKFTQYEPLYAEPRTGTLSAFLSLIGPSLYVKDMALVDMDGDGHQELLLRVGSDSLKYYGTEILRYDPETGTITGYMIWYRGLYNICADGTFEFNDNVSDCGIARLSFSENGYVMQKVSWREGEGNILRWYVDGVPAAEAAWDAVYDAHHAEAENVVWTAYSPEAAEALLGH